MMPIAMGLGIIFHTLLSRLEFLTPYLIFIMLFFTYTKIDWREIRVTKMHIYLLFIQFFGSIGLYLLLSLYNITVAQGVMICILAPTATSAPVIAGMLRGSVPSLLTYSVLSNVCVAMVAPLFFSFISHQYGAVPFFASFLMIGRNIFALLFLPLLAALLIKKISPRLNGKIAEHAGISFYIWSFALIIVTAKIVVFIRHQESANYVIEITIAALVFIVCVLQFLTGRKLGGKFGDTIAGGQGLGQKNTILAIWMAQTYLNPVSSIGPGTYVLWQNIVNSYQIWRKRKSL
jgi:BASS family bile acid:Na+ symporter